MTLQQITDLAARAVSQEAAVLSTRHELHALMRRARAEGYTLQQIGTAAGVGRSRIHQLVSKPL